MSFRREKYVPKGGPDGGDGGRGGHVAIRATDELNTLIDVRYHREYRARRGEHGKGKKMHGKNGEDLVIPVPVGTVVRDADSDAVIIDLDKNGMEVIVARGGKGGLGNAHFATPVRQAPRYAQPGEAGEEKRLVLELKLLADVGVIGLPNAGKSTLLSAISSARPKIAEYPFTTLAPVLGVVNMADYRSFVVADIPGIIEGAHRGAGLGYRFLRHIERTAMLLHLVDVSDIAQGDPVDNFLVVQKELLHYSPGLAGKPELVAGTKTDIACGGARLKRMKGYCRDKGIAFFPVSAVSGEGLAELLSHLAAKVEEGRESGKTLNR